MASAKCLDCGEWFQVAPKDVQAIIAFGARPSCPDCAADDREATDDV